MIVEIKIIKFFCKLDYNLYICITVLILPAVKVVKTVDMAMNNF